MNHKTAMVGFILLVTAIMQLRAQSQAKNGGLQIGATPPQNPVATKASPNPIQGMTSTVTGMGVAPNAKSSNVNNRPHVGNRGDNIYPLPPGGAVTVPGGPVYVEAVIDTGVYLNSSGIPWDSMTPPAPSVPTAPEAPHGSRGSSTSITRPSGSVFFTATDVSRIDPGTPRDKVIAKFGNPVASILNMNGETLYFSNAEVVFFKDGVVAVPVIR